MAQDQRIGITLAAEMDPSGIMNAIKTMQGGFNSLKLPSGITDNLSKEFTNITKLMKQYQSQMEKGVGTKADAKALTKTANEIDKAFTSILHEIEELNTHEIMLNVDTSKINELKSKLTDVKKTLNDTFKQNLNGAGIDLDKLFAATSRAKTAQSLVNQAKIALLDNYDFNKYSNLLTQLQNKVNTFKETTQKAMAEAFTSQKFDTHAQAMAAFNAKIEELRSKGENAKQSIQGLEQQVTTLNSELEQTKTEALERGRTTIEGMETATENTAASFSALREEVDKTADSTLSMKNQVEQLKSSTQYFFSLRNMINLLRRGIKQAVETVKELDAAMTETAVVTPYTVSDMWEKLPIYTESANKLGATIQDMYKSTTLYYQQGLNTQQAMSIATETMKMARIAGMEAADATDMMTAALRGFNMEINETSAERINDVYSQLAAKTASNTEELGTAMQRTASIAHSAGMSFEGTAAFLAQAIETTREPAENLGTAMKTIVARFQELKKNPLEIVEVDGEEVSYNKVDTALQSIGVSLKDTNGQFRDLDQVFLDISKRWDGLTQTQQRYIATTAAGSRQQSRFIAMMSNYNRTVELMDYANNSAGASTEQFNKTLDSLEAKLNKFKNAWNEFLMGIMNDSWIKGAVSGATFLLDKVNKLINTLSLGSKSLKSVLSIFTAFTALKAGGNIVNRLIGGLGGLVDPTSSFLTGFKGGAIKQGQTSINQAKAISSPIVQAIHQLQSALTNKPVLSNSSVAPPASYQGFKDANDSLRNFLNNKQNSKFSIADAYSKISGLDNRQQASVLGSLPGLTLSLKKNGIEFDTKDLSSGAAKLVNTFTQEVHNGLKDGTITTQNAMQIFGTPQNFKEAMEAKGPEYAKAASEVLFNSKYYQQQYDKYWKELDVSNNYAGYLDSEEALETRVAELQAQAKQKANIDAENKALEEYNQKILITQSEGAKLANSFGKVGNVAMLAGQGVAQLGMQLSSAGFETAGQAVTNLGYKISSLGTIASSVGSILGKLTETGGGSIIGGIGATAMAHPVLAAIAAAGVLITTLQTIKGNIEKTAKENAEKVITTYEDAINETTEKISKLNSAKDVFNELSKGIDKYGNNISLAQDEYDQYLQTSQEVAQLAPELIRGYDSQGRAIVATGAAIDELIDKQEELKSSAIDTFITNSSINDLLDGIRVSDAFKDFNKKQSIYDSNTNTYKTISTKTASIEKALSKAGVTNIDAIFKQLFGREINLLEPSNEDLRLLATHYTDIINLIESENKELTEKQKEGLQDAFVGLGDSWNALFEEAQPLSQVIGQYLSSENLDTIGLNLGEEFTESFNKGLESLTMTAITEHWDASKIKQEARDYAEGFRAITQEGSQYANIMKLVTAEQEKYNDSISEAGAISNYKDAVEQYAVQLGEALNSLSDEFTSARDAEERFKEATEKGDYYTAAEGYKNIIDTVLDDKNKAGGGSLTGWAGAEELLGAKYVDTHSWSEVVSQIEKLNKCFADGADGVLAFNDLLVANASELEGLGHVINGNDWVFDLQNEDLADYAEKLHMSEEALAALIDKARQWVPISLGDPSKIRQALEASEYSMTGTSSTGADVLYTSEAQFKAEARRQGIRGDDYTRTKSQTEKQGVRFLTVENLTTKNDNGKLYADQVLENIGLKGADKTLDNAVTALSKMGFSLEEQQQILTTDGIKLAGGQVSNEQVAESYNEHAYALENPTVAGIASDTGVIAQAATAMLMKMGILTEQGKQDIATATSKEALQPFTDGTTQTFNSTQEYTEAKNAAEAKLAELKATRDLLTGTGLENTEQYQQIIDAIELIEGEDGSSGYLNDIATTWESIKNNAQSYVDSLGSNQTDQNFLNERALDIANIWNNTDMSSAVEQLKQIEQEGNLSSDTIARLNQAFFDTHQIDLSKISDEELPHLISELGLTQDEVNQVRGEVAKPFVFSVLGGSELINYIDKIDSLTLEDKKIILSTELSGEEKVTGLLDNINEEFADGDTTKKRIIIEAAADFSNGNINEARQNLQNTFGAEGAQKIEQKLSVIYSGSIANPQEVQDSLEQQTKDLINRGTSGEEYDKVVTVKEKINTIVTNNTVQGDNSDVKNKTDAAKTYAQNTTATVSIDGNNDKAKAKIDSAVSYASGKTASIKINAIKGTGWNGAGWSISVSAHKHGRNYSLPAHQSLSFGAAAHGMNVPKKKTTTGSTTALVGEEGFEVGYIPSEQRSVIFGANGPEMTSFPSDTIIYPHKQSKEILRRGKGIHKTAGSFAGGNDTVSSGGLRSSVLSYSGGNNSTSKAIKKAASTVSKAATDTAKQVGTVSVWWENIARKTEATQRKMDDAQKAFEEYTKEMSSTLRKTGQSQSSGGGGGDDYLKKISEYIGYNEAQLTKVNQELTSLDTGTKAQIAALKTKSTKDDEKANKAAYNAGIASATKISYKSGKKSKEEIVNLAPFIKAENGTYIVDQKLLDTISNVDRRKAIADAANKEINDRISKRNTAEDNIKKANEALEKMGEELYETFFKWENELTKIWNITQKIEQVEERIGRTKAYADLLQAQLSTGLAQAGTDFAQLTYKAFEAGIQKQQEQMRLTVDSIGQQQEDLNKLLSLDDERTTLENLKKILIEGKNSEGTLNATQRKGYEEYVKELEKSINIQARAWQFMTVDRFSDGTVQVNFDSDAFEKQQLAGNITADAAKEIQDYVKSIEENSSQLGQAYETLISQQTDLINTLGSLQDAWASYADELWDISDAEQKKQVDNLKKLSDGLNKNLKNLLDDVKRKLDERRKQEDNAKTERDISQKQQRLAALRADTSGGNQVKIAQLEQEIADAQQSYQRSLEDQLLDRLQQQADVAAQQREQLISLQEATIDAVNNAALVNEWMNDPAAYQAEIYEAFKTANEYGKKPEALQQQLDNKFQTLFDGLLNNQKERDLVNDKLDEINEQLKLFTNKEVESKEESAITIELASGMDDTSVSVSSQSGKGVTEGSTLAAVKKATASTTTTKAATTTKATTTTTTTTKTNPYGKTSDIPRVIKKGGNKKDIQSLQWSLKQLGYYTGSKATIDGKWGPLTDAAVANFEKKLYGHVGNKQVGPQDKAGLRAKGYKTGGIADYTGPAWLHGTPSKPELVLNAKDTQNFIALKDVLSKAMGSTSSVENAYGGNATYEININVDHLNNDYDVDKVAQRVKKIIVSDSSYRNVTQVRKFK